MVQTMMLTRLQDYISPQIKIVFVPLWQNFFVPLCLRGKTSSAPKLTFATLRLIRGAGLRAFVSSWQNFFGAKIDLCDFAVNRGAGLRAFVAKFPTS